METDRPDTRASADQRANRQTLLQLFGETPLPRDELVVNLPLYMRSAVVAKLLYVNELYRLIVDQPGVIMEFGVWWGANMALFESLRAVYEPYNFTRKVVGFDTFDGYPDASGLDGIAQAGDFSVGQDYVEHLRAVLDYHQAENVMGHISKYELAIGDASVTLRDYLKAHPETIVALAYFDMQLYEPTRDCLETIRPYLARGSVIALDELNSADYPGETVAVREILGLDRYALRRSQFLPDRSYVVVD